MKRVLVALGLCLVNGIAQAQEGVLFCTIDQDNGYHKVNGTYVQSNFKLSRFTLKIEDNLMRVSINGETELYDCKPAYGRANQLACSNSTGNHMNYNTSNGHFLRLEGFGYVFGDNDSVSTSIGTCGAF